MHYRMRCAAGALAGATAALAALITALEVSLAAMPASRTIEPATLVDRTRKADRMPVVSGANQRTRSESEPQLPTGCLAESEWHTNIFSAEVAGRCVV
jgi:hypothetical protein